jgi:hypothetical protein
MAAIATSAPESVGPHCPLLLTRDLDERGSAGPAAAHNQHGEERERESGTFPFQPPRAV